MPDRGDELSMFDTVKNHEERISSLEENDKQREERIKKLEDNSIKLENTIMTENRDTRKTMMEQTEKLFGIVENAMGYQSTRTAQAHEFKNQTMPRLSKQLLRLSCSSDYRDSRNIPSRH